MRILMRRILMRRILMIVHILIIIQMIRTLQVGWLLRLSVA